MELPPGGPTLVPASSGEPPRRRLDHARGLADAQNLAGDDRTRLDLRTHLALRRAGGRGSRIIFQDTNPREGFRDVSAHCWTVEMAHEEWRQTNVGTNLVLLESTRADLHGREWRYVQRLCHSDLLTLKGHSFMVNKASFSPDGSRIVTGSADGTPKVWDARRGACTLTLKGHNNIVWAASFSPDGARGVTGSYDYTAKIWHTAPINRQLALANRLGADLKNEDQRAEKAERLTVAQ